MYSFSTTVAMALSSVGSFYRHGNSVTSHMLGLVARNPDVVDGTGPVPQPDDFTMTPPFTRTPSRWSSDSPHAYSSGGIGITQRLDRVLLMFDEMKQQVERDSVETKEQLSNLQDDK